MMSEAELTILSIIAESARYGYEIQQVIDERGLREWLTVGFSSIYYILNRLEKQNLLTSELHPDGPGPARKVYAITEAGRGVLQTAVSDLLRQPRALGSGFELGLANLRALKPKQAYGVLNQHRIDLRQSLESIEKSWERHQQDEEGAEHIGALYTHSIAMMQAELAWMESFLADWRERYPGVERDDERPSTQADPHRAVTRLGAKTGLDPAKMIQRLRKADKDKRPPSPGQG